VFVASAVPNSAVSVQLAEELLYFVTLTYTGVLMVKLVAPGVEVTPEGWVP
jgi:hypothetical protein